MPFPTGCLIRPPLAALLALALTAAAPAFATLGGGVASVEADRVKLQGRVQVTTVAGVTVHEITTAAGTRVREYLTPDGAVFGFTWHGPFIPDLRQLLGSYYQQYAHGVQEAHPVGRRHLSVQLPSLVVQSNGRMRAFSGRAWDPALLPQNFSLTNLN
ncbi:MAG: DUF2844 domain-containing protein [Steroidobacteraceae bacterium]|jgi:hypothetical protein